MTLLVRDSIVTSSAL